MLETALRSIEAIVRLELNVDAQTAEDWQLPRIADYLDHLDPAPASQLEGFLLDLAGDDSPPSRGQFRKCFAGCASALAERTGNFHRADDVPLPQFLAELDRLDDADWERDSRHKIKVQRETRAVSLMSRTPNRVDQRHNQYVREDNMYANAFPGLMRWLNDFSASNGQGRLQLARIVRLRAGGRVYPHVDSGMYYLIRDRYHIVLKSSSGSRMRCEEEESVWEAGEVWWFNNHVTHQAFNDGADHRIHVIFDVLPTKVNPLAPYLQQCADLAAQQRAQSEP